MKVFLFDLIAYGAHFEDAKADKLLPYPLPGHRFDPEIGARTFEQHLEAWAEMDRLGFDGVGTTLPGFTMVGEPSDSNLSVGGTQVVQWANTMYAIWDKTGALQFGPTNGNTPWQGSTRKCATESGKTSRPWSRIARRLAFRAAVQPARDPQEADPQ